LISIDDKSSFEPGLGMDLQKTIDFLRGEIRRLERVVASLEELRDGVTAAAVEKRRGRKSMSPEERREVSARMKKYWAGRLASR
jgi:hypothetical protein